MMDTSTYQEAVSLMDSWLVSHPEFLRARGEEPVTHQQMRDLRAASCELILRPNSQQQLRSIEEQRRLIARRDREARLKHLWYLVRVGEHVGVPVDLLELLERGSEAQRARFKELKDTYDAFLVSRPALVEDTPDDRPFRFRTILAVAMIALTCLVLFLLHRS